jgi:hypothetical protein
MTQCGRAARISRGISIRSGANVGNGRQAANIIRVSRPRFSIDRWMNFLIEVYLAKAKRQLIERETKADWNVYYIIGVF